jgi:hypothetical protein
MTDAIKDDALAATVRQIESRSDLTPAESRQLIRSTIEERYTIPAGHTDPGSS